MTFKCIKKNSISCISVLSFLSRSSHHFVVYLALSFPSIEAFGARGGQDHEMTDSVLAYGAHVHAKFALEQGDQILTVVGQRGYDSFQVSTDLYSL